MVQVHDLSLGAGTPLSFGRGSAFGRALSGGVQTANQVQNLLLKKQEAERRLAQEQRRQEQFDFAVGRAEQRAQEQVAGLREYQRQAQLQFDDPATPDDESLEMQQRLANMPASMRKPYLEQQLSLRKRHETLRSAQEFGDDLNFEMGQGSFALAPQAETIVPQLQEQGADVTQRLMTGEITEDQAARELDDLRGQARGLQVAHAKAEVKMAQRQEALQQIQELYTGAMEAPPENRQALMEIMAGVKNGLIDPARAMDQARDALYGRNVGGTTPQDEWAPRLMGPGDIGQQFGEILRMADMVGGETNGQARSTDRKKLPTAKLNRLRKAVQEGDKEYLKASGLTPAEVREALSGG